MQNFDLYGRLNQVAVDGITGEFTYGYLEGTHLQKTLAMPNGVTRTFGYEPNRDLLTLIVHSNATERLAQRDFTFDGLGRLDNRTLFRANETPVQPDAFGYNLRSELTNAVIGANAFSYAFDPIGNRLDATEFGTNTAYVASALNQYTSINPVNPVNPVENFNPEFDLDGNQTLLKTTTGIWHVTYNAENRPILFSNDTTTVEMAYDYMGRRFEYKEIVSGTLTRHERYLYSGYLQLVALDMLSNASVKHSIAWDPIQPAATRPLALQVGANAYFYSFDQVKNVTELFDSAGALATTYDYSPFGQVTSFQITQSGNTALTQFSNPLTFSSEVHDSTLGLQYYNYRHLNLLDGRWANRDSFGETGGKNMYGVARNMPVYLVDLLGEATKINISNLGELSIPDFKVQAIKDKENPNKISGLTYLIITPPYFDCALCEKSTCYFIFQTQDLEIVGHYYALAGAGNTRSGSTPLEHETRHVANARALAKNIDSEISTVASGCVSQKCCLAKKTYLTKIVSYEIWLRSYDNASLDVADYYPNDLPEAEKRLDKARTELMEKAEARNTAKEKMEQACDCTK